MKRAIPYKLAENDSKRILLEFSIVDFNRHILEEIIWHTDRSGANGLLLTCKRFEFLQQILNRLKTKETTIEEYQTLYHILPRDSEYLDFSLYMNSKRHERSLPIAYHYGSFVFAVKKGLTNLARHVLKNCPMGLRRYHILQTPCQEGWLDMTRLLLEDSRIDPSARRNRAIQIACRKGHLEIVKCLLADSRVDPSDSHNKAIKSACINGNLEIVKCLLKDSRVNPADSNCQTIINAYYNNRFNIIEYLIKDERITPQLINAHPIQLSPTKTNSQLINQTLQIQGLNAANL